MGGRKKDCAGDRRLAKSNMMAATTADDVAALLHFSRLRICMVELLYLWHLQMYSVRVVCRLR